MAASEGLARAPNTRGRNGGLAPGSVHDCDGGGNGEDNKDHNGSPRVGVCVYETTYQNR
jgi:hypothetical protein